MYKWLIRLFCVFPIAMIARVLLIVSAVIWLATAYYFDRLPQREAIDPRLMNEPIQTGLKRDASEFTIEYNGTLNMVKPVAEYELWGLVVTHNDITQWYDIYHDDTSIDTKDLCVIWGENLDHDYKKLKYSSGSWTCYAEWRGDPVTFHTDKMANNHLITNSDAIREIIDEVEIGDQIHMKGMLVNYKQQGQQKWRESSLIRNDDGCEVVFVEEIEILKHNETVLNHLYQLAKIVFFVSLAMVMASLILL